MDVNKTIDDAIDSLAEAVAQFLAQQKKRTDAQTAAIEKRVGELAGENVQLRAEIGELRGQIVKMATAKPRIRPRASTVSSGALT
jgi:phage shock protein A